MEKTTLEKYRKAGEIAAEALDFGKGLIESGAAYGEIIEKTEDRIEKLGGEPAFPVNLSVDETGAHDTADIGKERGVESGLVKLDVGVHVDGWIGDTAVTVPLDTDKKRMIKAVEDALDTALGMMVPGEKTKEVSAAIERTIKNYDYNPVKNLTGHGLGKYDLHANLQFPNVETDTDYTLQEGDVFALEPFATDGSGKVTESNRTLIYKWQEDKSVRSRDGRKILKLAKKDFNKLPFAKRWLKNEVSKLKLNLALKQLTDRKALYKYPVLKEVEGGDIAQAEHTVIVKKDPVITTVL